MSTTGSLLEELRQRIEQSNEPDTPAEYMDRLTVTNNLETFDLDFFGDNFGSNVYELFRAITAPAVAPWVRALNLRGPDEGANGTRNWDIGPLVETDVAFPRLKSFSIQLNQPGDHNQSVVASIYEEEGVIARLLARATNLQVLVTPSAPSQAFFEVGERPIEYLSVDSGYAHQNFIANLAGSSCFPRLRSLEWGEFNQTYLDDFLNNSTPFADYHRLFRSEAFKSVKRLVWRNPVCSEAEIKELKALRSDLQLLVVRISSEYVRSK